MKCFHCYSVFSESVFNVGILSVFEAVTLLLPNSLKLFRKLVSQRHSFYLVL